MDLDELVDHWTLLKDERELVAEYKSSGPAYRRTVQTTLRASYTGHYRRGLVKLLEVLEFRTGSSACQPVIEALALIRRYAAAGSLTYCPAGEHVPAHAGITEDWRPLVYRADQHGRQRVVRMVCLLRSGPRPPAAGGLLAGLRRWLGLLLDDVGEEFLGPVCPLGLPLELPDEAVALGGDLVTDRPHRLGDRLRVGDPPVRLGLLAPYSSVGTLLGLGDPAVCGRLRVGKRSASASWARAAACSAACIRASAAAIRSAAAASTCATRSAARSSAWRACAAASATRRSASALPAASAASSSARAVATTVAASRSAVAIRSAAAASTCATRSAAACSASARCSSACSARSVASAARASAASWRSSASATASRAASRARSAAARRSSATLAALVARAARASASVSWTLTACGSAATSS